MMYIVIIVIIFIIAMFLDFTEHKDKDKASDFYLSEHSLILAFGFQMNSKSQNNCTIIFQLVETNNIHYMI